MPYLPQEEVRPISEHCSVSTMLQSGACLCRLLKCRRKDDHRLPCFVIVGAISKARPWPLRLRAMKKTLST
jgi:hypothetical protein